MKAQNDGESLAHAVMRMTTNDNNDNGNDDDENYDDNDENVKKLKNQPNENYI